VKVESVGRMESKRPENEGINIGDPENLFRKRLFRIETRGRDSSFFTLTKSTGNGTIAPKAEALLLFVREKHHPNR
jgi:hypothetical protein